MHQANTVSDREPVIQSVLQLIWIQVLLAPACARISAVEWIRAGEFFAAFRGQQTPLAAARAVARHSDQGLVAVHVCALNPFAASPRRVHDDGPVRAVWRRLLRLSLAWSIPCRTACAVRGSFRFVGLAPVSVCFRFCFRLLGTRVSLVCALGSLLRAPVQLRGRCTLAWHRVGEELNSTSPLAPGLQIRFHVAVNSGGGDDPRSAGWHPPP